MTVSVAKAGPYYASGEIKFSSLRSNFRAQTRKESSGGSETFSTDTNPIKASDLIRNTTTTDTNPIVPDATENSDIVSSESNWKSSQFRNSIKFYYIQQSGTDLNFDIDAQTWNSNLAKNIIKVAFIEGTCGSDTVSSSAADFNATAYNFTIDVGGNIYGAAGRGGGTGSGAPDPSGQTGGNALTMASSGGNNVVVNVRSTGKIYGGGGGGERGAQGSNGANGECVERTRVQSGCQQSDTARCPDGWNQYNSGHQCCEFRRGCNANIWWKECERKYSTSGGTGGAGGTGGLGRGYNNQSGSLSGAGGSSGSSGGGCGAQNGGTGETGGSGGDWAAAGGNTSNSGTGGSSGSAISGSNYSVTGILTLDTIKGSYL